MAIRQLPLSRLRLDEHVRICGRGHLRFRFGMLLDSSGNMERRVAVKEASFCRAKREMRSAAAIERLRHEAQVLARVEHPGVLKLFGLCEEEDETGIHAGIEEGTKKRKSDRFLRIITEAALCTATKVDSPSDGVRILATISKAMEHIHSLGIIHRDLKPENIFLLKSGDARLADFDRAMILRDSRQNICKSNIPVGTLEYLAPEVLIDGAAHDKTTDVYSFGMLAFYLLNGRRQLYEKKVTPGVPGSVTRDEFIYALRDGMRPNFSGSVHLTTQTQELISQCWSIPERRPSFATLSSHFTSLLSQRDTRYLNTSVKKSDLRIKVGRKKVQGRRKTMEDRVTTSLSANNEYAAVAVFDGHAGEKVAEYAAEQIGSCFAEWDGKNTEQYTRNGLELASKNILNNPSINEFAQKQGSTATLVAMNRSEISCAWLGDSLAIVFWKDSSDQLHSLLLNEAHKPGLPTERDRIESEGGSVGSLMRTLDDGNMYPYGPKRLYKANGTGGLAVSRALGDIWLHPELSSEPDIVSKSLASFDLAPNEKCFVVVATDGLWDSMNIQDAQNMIWEMGADDTQAEDIAKRLTEAALEKGSNDNIAVAVAVLSFEIDDN